MYFIHSNSSSKQNKCVNYQQNFGLLLVYDFDIPLFRLASKWVWTHTPYHVLTQMCIIVLLSITCVGIVYFIVHGIKKPDLAVHLKLKMVIHNENYIMYLFNTLDCLS